jgi:hypothetical protein
MQGKWWVCEVTAPIPDHPVVDDPYLCLEPLVAKGDAAPGVGGEVLSFYFRQFLTGDRVYGAGGRGDRAIVPFASVILYI